MVQIVQSAFSREQKKAPKQYRSDALNYVILFLIFTSRGNKFVADTSGILYVVLANIRQLFIEISYMCANCIFPADT